MAFVRFAARDPGGANVIASLLAALEPDRRFAFDVWTMPRATPVFARFGSPAVEFAEDAAPAALAARWADPRPDVLVTGTSHYGGFEAPLWDLARASGIPALAVIDSWVNLESRFRDGRPDRVGYIDAAQAGALRALGFADDHLIHTGHPWLSHVRASARPRPAPQGDPFVVLFASEPIASDVAAGVNAPFGYDERDAFAVLHAVAVSRARAGRRLELRVRFHPYESPEAFLARVAALPTVAGLSVVVDPGSRPAHESLAAAHLVTGIGSMLLLEAFALERPVVSLQPGTIRGNVFVAGERGLTPTVVDPTQAEVLLGPLLDDAATRADLVLRQRAFLDAVSADLRGELRPWIDARLV